jgi:hypothetical protein
MYDLLYIGPCPADEPCAQLGVTEGFERLNRLECLRYVEALQKVYGAEPDGAMLCLKREHHDSGIYWEVICRFEDTDSEAVAYAYKVEAGLGTWAEADMRPPVIYDKKHQAAMLTEAA